MTGSAPAAAPVRVLFVCLGNICRSPLAEVIMRDLVSRAGLAGHIEVASAGTSDYHAGEPAHRGSIAAAERHGLSLAAHAARGVTEADLDAWDWLVAMDTDNRNGLQHLDRHQRRHDRIVLLLDYAHGDGPRDVPDPYYSGGFEAVYALITRGCEGLLEAVRSTPPSQR